MGVFIVWIVSLGLVFVFGSSMVSWWGFGWRYYLWRHDVDGLKTKSGVRVSGLKNNVFFLREIFNEREEPAPSHWTWGETMTLRVQGSSEKSVGPKPDSVGRPMWTEGEDWVRTRQQRGGNFTTAGLPFYTLGMAAAACQHHHASRLTLNGSTERTCYSKGFGSSNWGACLAEIFGETCLAEIFEETCLAEIMSC